MLKKKKNLQKNSTKVSWLCNHYCVHRHLREQALNLHMRAAGELCGAGSLPFWVLGVESALQAWALSFASRPSAALRPFLFGDRVLCGQGWPPTPYSQTVLDSLILLPAKHWDGGFPPLPSTFLAIVLLLSSSETADGHLPTQAEAL